MPMPPARRPHWPTLPPPMARWALFLDVDGGLLELQPTPGDVVASPEVVDLLGRLKCGLRLLAHNGSVGQDDGAPDLPELRGQQPVLALIE